MHRTGESFEMQTTMLALEQFLITPLQHIHIQPQAKALAHDNAPQEFPSFIFGPRPNRQLVYFHHYDREACARIHCSSLGPGQGSQPSIRPA